MARAPAETRRSGRLARQRVEQPVVEQPDVTARYFIAGQHNINFRITPDGEHILIHRDDPRGEVLTVDHQTVNIGALTNIGVTGRQRRSRYSATRVSGKVSSK